MAEDDVVMRSVIAAELAHRGWAVRMVNDGASALEAFLDAPTDLVILDVHMPGMNGHQVCQALRRRTAVPVIFITGDEHIDGIIAGYAQGADLVLTKPIVMKELALRVSALLRRMELGSVPDDDARLNIGGILVDRNNHQVSVHGHPVQLTPNEYTLLCYFMEHSGRPIEKEELMQEVWGHACDDEANLLRVTVRRLRSKIEPTPSNPTYLHTVRGVGYMFAAPMNESHETSSQ